MSKDKERNKIINECLVRIQSTRKIEYVEMLYDLISPTIRHIALKYLHNEDLAEDLVQDFWTDIYKIVDEYGFHFNANAYLCKVATNRAINKYKKLKKEKAYITYVDYSSVEFASCTHDTEREDLIISVHQAMKKLNEVERIIIQSTYFEGKTIREIATELKLSKSTVGRLKNEALDKLKVFFCQEGEGEQK